MNTTPTAATTTAPLNPTAMVTACMTAFGAPPPDAVNTRDDGLNCMMMAQIAAATLDLNVTLEGGDPHDVVVDLAKLHYVIECAYVALGLAGMRDYAFKLEHDRRMKIIRSGMTADAIISGTAAKE